MSSPSRRSSRSPHRKATAQLEPITDKEFKDVCEQLENQHTDKDRARLVKRVAANYVLDSKRIKELCAMQSAGDAKVESAIVLYRHCSDKDNYEVVLEAFRFEEDKTAIRSKLGLKAAHPEPDPDSSDDDE